MSAANILRRLNDTARWLPGYVLDAGGRSKRSSRVEHLILCFVDHFEPSWGQADETQAAARLQRWVDDYPKIAATIYDATGRTLPHSWFYPFDEARASELAALAGMVFGGWGEIDLHLHHFNDTAAGLTQKLHDAVALFGRYGALCDQSGQPSFGFIHGNWALGNSIPAFCGVDDELPILRAAGCFGDFTFPAPNRCQPQRTNRIYAASERAPRPHEYGGALGSYPSPTLPIVQGPLRVTRLEGRVRIDDGEVDAHNPYLPGRFPAWTRAGITVRPQKQWGFVKIFTHGAPEQSAKAVLDDFLPQLPEAIEQLGIPVVFATAREFLNMAYAAAAGKTGNPADYRDAYIPPPLGRRVWAEGGADIAVDSEGAIELKSIGAGKIMLAADSGKAITLTGPIEHLHWDRVMLKLKARGPVALSGTVAAPGIKKGTGSAGHYEPTGDGEVWLKW